MITVIDLKISNIASIKRALEVLKVQHLVTDSPTEIMKAEKLILPGVGNFYEAMKRLQSLDIKDALKEAVMVQKKEILGICLGMQLFATFGEEGGRSEGLNFIKGNVSYHRASRQNLQLPHIGWNDVFFKDFKLFDSIDNQSCFYFVHSYEFIPNESLKVAYSNYGVDFVAAFQKDNIFGVQFHPEKSQKVGLKLLSNFCEGNI